MSPASSAYLADTNVYVSAINDGTAANGSRRFCTCAARS